MNDHTRTIGVGVGPCTVPAAGTPTFELRDGTMDVGMGIHGEAGLARRPLAQANEVADELVTLLLDALQPQHDVCVLVNTLGATPMMEGLVVLRRVSHQLAELGIPVHRARVGEYVTSLEMAGLSLTLVALDDELRRLLDAPGRTLAAPSVDEPW
jgi:dihydroxyacetone kinase-like protein